MSLLFRSAPFSSPLASVSVISFDGFVNGLCTARGGDWCEDWGMNWLRCVMNLGSYGGCYGGYGG
jgi:hypothetical protein